MDGFLGITLLPPFWATINFQNKGSSKHSLLVPWLSSGLASTRH